MLFYLNCPIIMPLWVTLLADLSKHKRYEIRLSVYNAVGEGPSSAPQEVFVGEAGMFLTCSIGVHHLQFIILLCVIITRFVGKMMYISPRLIVVPTAPPQSVVVQSSTATQLEVTWDPPPLDAQNGDIQGYKVSIMGLVDCCCKSAKLASFPSWSCTVYLLGRKKNCVNFAS